MEKIVTINLFGARHKFKTEDSEIDARQAVNFLVGEIDKTCEKVSAKRSQMNQFNLLLLAALNISSQYIKQQKEHSLFSERLSVRYDALIKKIDDAVPSSSDKDEPSPQPLPEGREDSCEEREPSHLPVPPDSPNKAIDASPSSPSSNDDPAVAGPLLSSDNGTPVIHASEAAPPSEMCASISSNEAAASSPLCTRPYTNFRLPPISFLNNPAAHQDSADPEYLNAQAERLENKLNDFGIKGEVVNISPGPVITTFEYKPAPGIKISRIVNLSDDLALALSALSIRIVAPIPGRDVIGIELPNATREIVYLKDIIASDEFYRAKSKLTLCLGKDIIGKPVTTSLDKMPHLLIAGATGTGKSVALNAMITSILYNATPNEVKFIMIDPKRIELSFYNDIPHLITPVVTDMKKATNALFWAVKEMEKRYDLLAESKVKNIRQYNREVKYGAPGSTDGSQLPFIVIIIDELADLMMVASRDVEVALARLAQMARAAGIHLVLATQRPSVDVLTGVIKANFPTRISFQVSSKIDSRTIIDSNGAENLLGNGDMLFLPPGTAKLARIHGAYISEEELTKVISFLKDQTEPDYIEDVTEFGQEQPSDLEKEDYDERYDEAVALVTKTRQASISGIQRHMRIGYNRAARMIETMEKEGIVGPSDGAKPREVLVKNYVEE